MRLLAILDIGQDKQARLDITFPKEVSSIPPLQSVLCVIEAQDPMIIGVFYCFQQVTHGR